MNYLLPVLILTRLVYHVNGQISELYFTGLNYTSYQYNLEYGNTIQVLTGCFVIFISILCILGYMGRLTESIINNIISF